MTNIDFGSKPASFAHDTFESRMMHDRQFTDLSERYDPREEIEERIAKDYRIFDYAEILLLSCVWACALAMLYANRAAVAEFIGRAW